MGIRELNLNQACVAARCLAFCSLAACGLSGCAVVGLSDRGSLETTPPATVSTAEQGAEPAIRPVNFVQETAEDETGASLAIDLEFEAQPLDVVMLSLLFDAGRFKIVGSRTIPVTATIRAVSVDDAMQQLQDQSDLLIVRQGERFVVYSEGAENEVTQPITFVYKCRRAKATDLIGIIDGAPPEGFPTAGEPFLGETIVPSQEAAMASQTMAISGLDQPLGNASYQVVHHMNAILLQGELADIRTAVDFLKTIDRPLPIVLVELLVVQYFHEDGFSWRYDLLDGQIARADAPVSNGAAPGITLDGFEDNTYGPKEFNPIGGFPEGPGYGFNFERIALSAAAGGGPLHYSGIGSLTSAFKQNVQLLVNEDLARVVTNPHIGVINGHKGTIMLNEKFNFFTNIVQPITGVIEQQQQELNNVTALTATPTIVGPERIHMAINATVSAFVGNVAGGLSVDLPDQRINDIATSVVLSDNETLIIGGLVKEEMIESRNKIPGFANIPLLGYLFRGKNTTRRFTETVIYVTPRLSQPQGYEDEYMKQVFQQVDRLGERTETIRDKHRAAKQDSHMRYRLNERLDHQLFKKTLKDEVHHHHQLWHPDHPHPPGPILESIEPGTETPISPVESSGPAELVPPINVRG